MVLVSNFCLFEIQATVRQKESIPLIDVTTRRESIKVNETQKHCSSCNFFSYGLN